ncbi:hypothetical protein GC173_08385 [bacterium]|nr:hypothetical protein [bacterium]
MNQEKLNEILQLLLKRLDLVVTGALVLLMVVTGWMLLQEQGFTAPPLDDPPLKELALTIPLPNHERSKEIKNKAYEEVETALIQTDPDLNKNPDAKRLIVNNMFTIKSAAETEAAREENNKKYNQAERLFSEGNIDAARKLVDEILLNDPANRNAQELKARFDAPATPTPTP